MNPEAIIKELQSAGFSIKLDSGKIQVEHPDPCPPEWALQALGQVKENREKFILYLSQEAKNKQPPDEEYFDRCFREMLAEVTADDPGEGYLEYEEPENQAAISRAECKLGAAWARALSGDESARDDFDQALEELKKSFLLSIDSYKKK